MPILPWILSGLGWLGRGVWRALGGSQNAPENIYNLLRILGGGLGAAADQNQQQWLHNLIATAIARGENLMGSGQDIINRYLGGLEQLGGYAPMLFDESLNATRTWRDLASHYIHQLDPMMDRFLGTTTPNYDLAITSAWEQMPGMGQISDVATQGFLGGGWTPFFQNAYDLGFGAARDPFLSVLSGLGSSLIAGQGQTPFTQAAEQAAINALTSAGQVIGPAQQAALQLILSGGETPLTSTLGDISTRILSSSPLLTMSTAMNIAREQAAQQARNQLAQLQAQAARVGGPGAVSAGSRMNPLLEFQDQVARNVSAATLNALAQQQALQSQLWGRAGDLASTALAESARRLGLGFGFLPSGQQSIASMLSAASNLGEAGLRGALSRMQLGMQAGTAPLEIQLAALRSMSPIMEAQTRYALGLGNLGLAGRTAAADLARHIAATELSRLGMGGDLFRSYMGAATGMLGQFGNASTGLSNLGLNWALEPLYKGLETGTRMMGLGAEGAFGPARSAFGSLHSYPGWSNFFWNLGRPNR